MLNHRNKLAACLAAGIAMLWATAGYTQEEPSGTWIDGVFVEGYVYEPEFIAPEKLRELIGAEAKDVVIVDTAHELIYEDEHIPGAVNFPYAPTIATPITLPRDKTLVIYCACPAEEESVDVAEQLAAYGYRNVKVLKGGWFHWLELGYETEGLAVEGSAS
jgi:rhodanese-related sulfurtransferase